MAEWPIWKQRATTIFALGLVVAQQHFMHLWELLKVDTWLKTHIADDGNGLIVSPHSSKAKRFSLLGGLIRCYVPTDKIWTPEFEHMRSSLFASIVVNKELRVEVKSLLGHNSLSKIPLYELNKLANWSFVNRLLQTLQTISKNR